LPVFGQVHCLFQGTIMASIGDILDEFFSPFSGERLWVMSENDEYTLRVRAWQPVRDAISATKSNLAAFCSLWASTYVSAPSWQPGKTDAPKPGAYRAFVPSPPGTDPETCKSAFVVYVASKAAGAITPGVNRGLQTDNLYTCSIGSFNIYTTVDLIDCAAKTATMNFWMYNAMSRRSFGRFAEHPVFALCGMRTQYMWWNWVENVNWTSGVVRTVPRAAGTGGW
jgi:hypothetical protein